MSNVSVEQLLSKHFNFYSVVGDTSGVFKLAIPVVKFHSVVGDTSGILLKLAMPIADIALSCQSGEIRVLIYSGSVFVH